MLLPYRTGRLCRTVSCTRQVGLDNVRAPGRGTAGETLYNRTGVLYDHEVKAIKAVEETTNNNNKQQRVSAAATPDKKCAPTTSATMHCRASVLSSIRLPFISCCRQPCRRPPRAPPLCSAWLRPPAQPPPQHLTLSGSTVQHSGATKINRAYKATRISPTNKL